jgi:heme A synthase
MIGVTLAAPTSRASRFAWGVLGYNLLVILWGALVRATGSGAGCGAHWPLCDGEVIPRAPELTTLIEFSHRVSSGLALLLVVALVVVACRVRPAGHRARAAAVASLLLILVEAGIGAGLVLFELVANDASLARAFAMAAHLVNTFALLGALTLTAHFLAGGAPLRLRERRGAALGLLGAMVAVVLVGMSGAIAALGDTLFPARSLAEALQADLAPGAHLLIRLRLLHPVLAVATGVGLVGLAVLLPAAPEDRQGRFSGRALAGLALLQLLVGSLNVALLGPVWLQLVHLLLADLVWIALVRLGASVLGGDPVPQRVAQPIPASG